MLANRRNKTTGSASHTGLYYSQQSSNHKFMFIYIHLSHLRQVPGKASCLPAMTTYAVLGVGEETSTEGAAFLLCLNHSELHCPIWPSVSSLGPGRVLGKSISSQGLKYLETVVCPSPRGVPSQQPPLSVLPYSPPLHKLFLFCLNCLKLLWDRNHKLIGRENRGGAEANCDQFPSSHRFLLLITACLRAYWEICYLDVPWQGPPSLYLDLTFTDPQLEVLEHIEKPDENMEKS